MSYMAVLYQIVHSRILHNAGTERIGFSPIRPTLLAPSAKRRGVFGESHEGRGMHPTKNRLQGGLRHLVRPFLHMDESFGGVFPISVSVDVLFFTLLSQMR